MSSYPNPSVTMNYVCTRLFLIYSIFCTTSLLGYICQTYNQHLKKGHCKNSTLILLSHSSIRPKAKQAKIKTSHSFKCFLKSSEHSRCQGSSCCVSSRALDATSWTFTVMCFDFSQNRQSPFALCPQLQAQVHTCTHT